MISLHAILAAKWSAADKEGDNIRRRITLCFPDVYEVAESHIGLKILYDIINPKEEIAAERVYAMCPD